MRVSHLLSWAALIAVSCFGGPFGMPAFSQTAQSPETLDGQVETEDTSAAGSEAMDLEAFIVQTVENHDRLLGSEASLTAAQERSIESLGAWYPTLDLTANLERYRLQRSQTQSTIHPAREVTATITQLLWDFGSSNATIETSRLEHVQAELGLVQTRQDLIAEAISAYINLIRSADVVLFARRSEENIRRQTGLEEARIEAGSGLSTDLLQAKTQLAGAQARRVDSEGQFEIALNRYRAVFGDVPGDLDALPGLDLNRDYIPGSLEEALELAYQGNLDLRLTSLDLSIARQARLGTMADAFAPTFELIGEQTMLENDGGTAGRRVEQSIKLELSFPFNLGFTSINTLRAAQADVVSSSRAMGDLELQVEERVRNAWTQFQTAQQRAGYLFDQAGIARAFLEVAVQERQLGQRSLIDVLSGETSLINAQSDAIAAEAEVLLAIVELLAASGSLDYGVIRTVERADREEMLEPIAGLGAITAPDPVMNLLGPIGEDGGILDPSQMLGTGQGISPPPGTGDGLAPLLDPNAPLDPTQTLDPGASQTTPLQPSPAPDEPPVSSLELEGGAANDPDALRNSFESAPSFGTDPVEPVDPPQTPADAAPIEPEVTPPADSTQLPGGAAELPFPNPPAAPPRSSRAPAAADVLTGGTQEPDQPEAPVSDQPSTPDASPPVSEQPTETDLDNPLFDWAQ